MRGLAYYFFRFCPRLAQIPSFTFINLLQNFTLDHHGFYLVILQLLYLLRRDESNQRLKNIFEVFYFFSIVTCAMKATKIWDVLNVATVEGGIIVRDLIIQIKPKMPIHPTPKDVAKSFY